MANKLFNIMAPPEPRGVEAGKMDPEVAKNHETYRNYQLAQSDWTDRASEDLEFFNGLHWTKQQRDTLESRGQQASVVEVMYQIVDQAVAMMTAKDPRYSATARDNSDRPWASFVADLLQWIWQKSDGNQEAKRAIQDYYVMSRGVLVAYIDPNADFGKGDVRFVSVDPRDVYPDPNSMHPLFDDASSIIIRRLYTEEQIRQRWGNIDLSNVAEAQDVPYGTTGRGKQHNEQIHPDEAMDLHSHRTFEVIERYTKVPRPYFRIVNPNTGIEEVFDKDKYEERRAEPAFIIERQGHREIVTEPNAVAELDAIHDNIGPVFHYVQPQQMTGDPQMDQPQIMPGPENENDGSIPGSTTRLFPVTMGQLIDNKDIPLVEFKKDKVRVIGSVGHKKLYKPYDLPTSHYPIINIPNTHNRNPYTISDVRRTKPLQEQINKMFSLIMAHFANSTNLKVFYPEGTLVDKDAIEQEWAKAGTAMIPYRPELGQRGGIEIVAPPQPPAALFAQQDRMIGLMERIFGVYSLQQGDPATQAETARGTVFMDEMSIRRMKGKMADIYRSLSRLGQVCLELAQDIYTEEKSFEIVGPNGDSTIKTINEYQRDENGFVIGRINDITKGHYDVVIVSGSTLPSNRWALLQEYKEMFQLGLVDDRAVLTHTELPDAERILERNGMLKQLQQYIQQVEEENKKLKGDLQTAQRAEVNALKRLEVYKDTNDARNAAEDMRKASEIYDATLRAELSKQVALAKQQARPNGQGN